MHDACAVVDRTRRGGQPAGASAQLAVTYASAASASRPSITAVRWSPLGQLAASVAIRQHGLLVAYASPRSHGGKLRPGAGAWRSTALTMQSYCVPAAMGSSSASEPAKHGGPMTVFTRSPTCCSAPERSWLQIDASALWSGN